MGGRGSGSSMGRGFTHEDHLSALNAWANTDEHRSVRHGDSRRNEAILEDYIAKSAPVTQTLMRGVSISDSELASISEGGIINMNGISSWTTRKGIAQSFARNRVSDGKSNQVVFTLKGGSANAAKMPSRTAGGSRYGEGEAIMSKKAKFRVVSKKWSSWGRTEVVVEEVR